MSFRHLDAVVAEVTPLAERFAQAGHRLYLVGGIVRDLWLDRALDASSDIDLTTDASPATTKSLVAELAEAVWTQGERFGTIGILLAGREIEITTHRAESYTPESRKPVVSFGDDITVDLSRRDFTVNAMAIEVPGAVLVDPWSGIEDLRAGWLRTPLAPEVSFTDDPLRMMRAARFAAKYGLEPGVELLDAASRLRDRLRIVAIERIGDELHRLFGLEHPGPGVDLLVQTGLADVLLGWGADGPATTDRGRLEDAVGAVAPGPFGGTPITWHARFAAFALVALGEVDAVDDLCRRLRLSRHDSRRISGLCHAAAAIGDVHEPRPPTLRRWWATANDPLQALAVARARAVAASGDLEGVERFAAAHAALAATEDPADLVVLDGETIMEALGLEAGRVVGDAVEVLREALFDEGPLDREAQLTRLRRWWSHRTTER